MTTHPTENEIKREKPGVSHRRDQTVDIGAVWVSIIEPDVDHELVFNRWYGDDHFYAGGMALPALFAGRRWVAPKRLQAMRMPPSSTSFQPLSKGIYFHSNLIVKGGVEQFITAWEQGLRTLATAGRMRVTEAPRTHVYTALTDYVGAVYRDANAGGPLDIHALDYPFDGLVVEIIDAAAGVDRSQLVAWLQEVFIPARIGESSAEMCLIVTHAELPPAVRGVSTRLPASYGASGRARVVLLWLLNSAPEADGLSSFSSHEAAVALSGLGAVQLIAPFIPTVPGSDKYVDELR